MTEDAPRESVLSRLRGVRGVSYEWKDGEEHRSHSGHKRELGVIAQEVEAAFPEAVDTAPDGYKRVDYLGLVAVLIEAVKELEDRVASLEERA